ncbi:MAG TPA: hypothetical protein PK331_02280 [Gordonia sp. (in: high G+C Gram-positive bacteria)]|uniref:hypothetical protein n=1 Tax=unclassified Gordonia (in: high G+C Gram-positive bacteria) TaxID=2657482 RepID=UPI000FB126DD|nr:MULTISPECIES: hypothetical protein [unclassified Gordonia (in: high G+C Gram-positive bacteria)]RTL08796.1 MAG: hypothetical protein EKK62_05510 [Acidimicrobiia bacterium]HNP57988.1 hypothetical protein [Gordonia sp. (in: high G+C Gram-positive bacteria)]HRC49736.1 hypothetical protein [Gordonia sp. (in: high G+C Gram-positive bacteria)]
MKLRIAAVTAGIALAIVAPVTTASAAGPTMSAHSQDAGPFGIGVVVTLTNTGSRTIGGCVFGLRQGGHAPVAPGQLQAGRIPVGSTWSGAFPPVPAGKYRVSARCYDPFQGPSDVVTPNYFWNGEAPVASW